MVGETADLLLELAKELLDRETVGIYDKKGRKKPRLRVHPGLKFTQSQRPSF